MFNPLLKRWVGKGDLDYEKYLKTDTLLNLQTSPEALVHHDELLFQVTHQSQELWMKLISREAVEVVAEMDGDLLWPATGRLERMLRAMRCLVQEMSILETMTPDTYQIIRRSLGNGSGQESPGYNAIRLSADALEAALERALIRRNNLRLVDVYKVGAYGTEDLKRICEQFVDFDELFQTWLYTHYQMVRRIIGVDRSIKALDGLPTQVLAGRMTLPLFRKLWEVRVEMTNAWRRDGGYAPGTARQAAPPPSAPGAAASAQAPSPPAATPRAPSEQAVAAYAPGIQELVERAAGAQAPSAPAPEAPAVAAPPAAPPVAPSPAEALASTAAQVDPGAVAKPEAAVPEDPWSKPEPPTSRRSFGNEAMAPTNVLPPADPWSATEPPTSRRLVPVQEETAEDSSSPPGPVGPQ